MQHEYVTKELFMSKNKKETIALSVRSLVEYSLRSGDLDIRFFGTAHPVAGIRAHQAIQRNRPSEYVPEVSISRIIETGQFNMVISGRIDGVYTYPDKVIIDEIKSTRSDPGEVIRRENALHWGQAKVYAYLYLLEHNLGSINVQLTYYGLETDSVSETTKSFTRDELDTYFQSLVKTYIAWANRLVSWRRVRDDAIARCGFPFQEYRPGQREMAAAVYRTIEGHSQLLIQAPTGIGKTVAVLFSAVKALGGRFADKLFYVTARTTGKAAAEQALAVLTGSGLRLKHLTLTAKERICAYPERTCTPDECPRANGHFDRVNDAVGELFETSDAWTREHIEDSAVRFTVCPFELSLEMALWADCIICDYNYVFDPRVYLRRFFEEEQAAYALLVDESHNLPGRARDMFSASLRKKDVLDLRKSLKETLPGVARKLSGINSCLLDYRKRCETDGSPIADPDLPGDLLPKLRTFAAAAGKWLALNIPAPFRENLLDFYFQVNAFLRIAERHDRHYVTLYEAWKSNLSVKLFCMDPSANLAEALKRCTSTVFFSATMIPMQYFKTILGCAEDTAELVLPSPFPSEHLGIFTAGRISTKYRDRTRTAGDVTRMLGTLVSSHSGNYLLFFPSYAYLAVILEPFREQYPDIEIIVQSQGMTEAERAAFLERFSHDNPVTLAGFAVMGGVFGEGIDLVGDRLTGAAIVGVGLPGISPERDLIREYFQEAEGDGFSFAYRYPGIVRVLQAAGRVIRSETDRGVVLLIDNRFGSSSYKRLLPAEWREKPVAGPDMLADSITAFWNG